MNELPWTGSCVLTPLVSFLYLLGGRPGVHLEPLHRVGSLASSRKTRLDRRSGEIGVVAPWIPSTCLPIPSFLLSLLWGLPTLAAPSPSSHCHSVQFSSVVQSCLTLRSKAEDRRQVVEWGMASPSPSLPALFLLMMLLLPSFLFCFSFSYALGHVQKTS